MVPSRVTKWMCLPPAVVPCSVVYTACTTVVTIERIVPCAVVAVPIARIIKLSPVVTVPIARIIKLSPVAHNIAHIPILVVCVIAFICELHFFISPSQYVYVYRHACKSFHLRRSRDLVVNCEKRLEWITRTRTMRSRRHAV